MAVATSPDASGDYHRRRWTVTEFQHAAESGVFGPDERLELIHGEIFEKMPPNPPHAVCVDVAADCLAGAFSLIDGCVRREKPIVLDADNQPEPDIAVVRGQLRDYTQRHPALADVLLLVEVSDSTLEADRRVKGSDYAAAGVPEYWIINLRDRCVEVHRTSQGGIWTTAFIAGEGDAVSALAAPLVSIPVAELLP